MKTIPRKAWILGAFAAAAGVFWAAGGASPANPVTVYAASSLQEVATEVASEWSRRSGKPVRLQFEATSTLARQIREGAPADLFLAASPEWLDTIKTLEHFDWLGNRLACVVRPEYPLGPCKESGDVDLAKAGSLALANEQVPAGKYARAALDHLGIPLPPRVIYGANVRDVLSKVSQGAAETGIVYATDAEIEPAVRIAFLLPEDSHPPIVYAVGLLTARGRELYDNFRQPWALEMARKRGFRAPR